MRAAVATVGRHVLPRGWFDLVRQSLIWFGFYFGYMAVRHLADRNPARAVANGIRVVSFEQRTMHHLFEQTAQRIADSSHLLLTVAAWTYWNSEFTVIGIALLWVYLRRHDAFARFRNTIMLANVIGLVGYVTMPTAPPWMFHSLGFVDGVNHSNGLLGALANPYAAMPSLHAADSLIVGVLLAGLTRNRIGKVLWLLWPVWVWFCVMATANHYLLDVVAGAAVGLLSLAVITRLSRRTDAAPIANLL